MVRSKPRPSIFPDDVTWTPVDSRLATLRMAGVWLCAAPVVVGLGVGAIAGRLVVLAGAALVVVAVAAWLSVLVKRQVKAIGYMEGPEEFFLRRGILVSTCSVIPYGRLQYIDVNAGPLARRLGLATVEMHTAAVGVNVTIPGLPTDAAAGLRERLVARGEARMSGL
ncbi:MAG: PH domain-containing protein [Bifidobacteriaceae bacterium]|jgi:membrane protein YdbS with pleckstrin-like domain|nr:PH domain-containing protein [Bifidobacteriaceae bacterium]